MKRFALFVFAVAWTLTAHGIPDECDEIQSFNPTQHERNYELLENLRARCEAALAASDDAKVRSAVAYLQLPQELEKAHQARLGLRIDLLQRTRAVVERFRQAGRDAVVSMPDFAFAQALKDLGTIAQSADQSRMQTFTRFLPDNLGRIRIAPQEVSEETAALLRAVEVRVASAAARSDAQTSALDVVLQSAIDTARVSITQLRTSATLAADKTNLAEFTDKASADSLAVLAEVAFARFMTRVKARTVLLQANAAANAGARNAAQARAAYLDRAYLAFSSALPERLRVPLAERTAADFLRQLDAVRQLAKNLSDAESESRMRSYIALRATEFRGYRAACLTRAGGNAADLKKLEGDLSSLPTALRRLDDVRLRVFVLESIVDRIETARTLCKEAV